MRKCIVVFVIVIVNNMKQAVGHPNHRNEMDEKQGARSLSPFGVKGIRLARLKISERRQKRCNEGNNDQAMAYLANTFVYHIYFIASYEAVESAEIFPS